MFLLVATNTTEIKRNPSQAVLKLGSFKLVVAPIHSNKNIDQQHVGISHKMKMTEMLRRAI